MKWQDKCFHTLNYELRHVFGQKVFKLSLDGGFTCPNRDGLKGKKGCLFCSDEGSGEFAGPRHLTIKDQIEQQLELLAPKWKTGKYIAYFQNFTNTYGSVAHLEKVYEEALSYKGIVGLAIATRPDCLPEDVLNLLEKINRKTYLWVELGLQTIHEKTGELIRRGYDLKCFERAVHQLRERGIRVVTHLIVGLPGETKADILASSEYIARQDIQGVKLHLMHILEGTDLAEYYHRHPFPLLSKEDYIDLIVEIVERLPAEMVIHRLTGDGAKDKLIGPRWSLHKLGVLSGIDQAFKKRQTYQGKKFDSKKIIQ